MVRQSWPLRLPNVELAVALECSFMADRKLKRIQRDPSWKYVPLPPLLVSVNLEEDTGSTIGGSVN